MSEKLIVLYRMSTCPPCNKMKPEWDKFKKLFQNKQLEKHNIKFAEYEVNEEEIVDKTSNITEVDKKMILSERDNVNGFPTIKLYADNKEIKEFNGERTAESILKFVENNSKTGGGDDENGFEEYQEGDGNFDQCGGGCDGNKCEFKGGKRGEEYYKMKYFKYKAKYIDMKKKYNAL